MLQQCLLILLPLLLLLSASCGQSFEFDATTTESVFSYLNRQEWFRPALVALAVIVLWEIQRRRTLHDPRGGISTTTTTSNIPMTVTRAGGAAGAFGSRTPVTTTATEQKGQPVSRPSRLLDQLERERQEQLRQRERETTNGKQSVDDTSHKEDDDNDNTDEADYATSSTTKQKTNGSTRTATTTSTTTATPPQKSFETLRRDYRAAKALEAIGARVPPPPIKATTNHHPGMDGFCNWYDVETSLYRIYTLGRSDDEPVVPPYTPQSHRGQVDIFLHITNKTNSTFKVYWVDYKGKYEDKGTLKPNHVWTQTTYIDHPWVIEQAETQIPVLYYVPYRVIPTLSDVPTVTEDGVGRHEFSILPPRAFSCHWISVQDTVLPHPARDNFPNPVAATSWTLQHLSRMMVLRTTGGVDTLPEVSTLLKFLSNIVDHPAIVKYRQLRIASKAFAPIWQSPFRGLLLAIGFVDVGMYAELGCQTKPLSPELIQDVALLAYQLRQWQSKEFKAQQEQEDRVDQPLGADGFGRAGFNRAGTMH
jgi:hypothetical protein